LPGDEVDAVPGPEDSCTLLLLLAGWLAALRLCRHDEWWLEYQ